MVAVMGLVLALSGCFPPYEPVHENDFLGTKLEFSSIDVDGHSLYIVQSGDPDKPLVLFVHGTPGSWQGYAKYLQMTELTSVAHLVAMDRPGFGESSHNGWFPSFREQASILMQLRQLNHSGLPIIVVGHSLGGSIAYRMLVDFPDEISGLVVISASVDPELGKGRWYNTMASYAVIRWMLPSSLVKANREIMPLEEELRELAPLLGKVKSNVTVIHGTQDKLVNFGNLGFAERNLSQAKFKAVPVEDTGHFVLWEKPELIATEILSLLESN